MRKVFILSLLMVISFLNASYLVDVYHRDYGVIDRTVLVFDTKPQYKIFTNESNIQINLQECRKNISLKKLAIPNSKVLTSYDYIASEDQVTAMIDINISRLPVTSETYKVNIMELQEDVFKLVLDIFILANPQSLFELTSYASFYKTTGYFKLAEEYEKLVVNFKDKIKQQENATVQSKQIVNSKKQTKVIYIIQSLIQKFNTEFTFKIVGIALVSLFLLFVVIFILSPKKASKIDLNKKLIRPTDGFADDTFMEKVARKLAAKDWKVEEIAKELELPLEKVKKIIDLENK
ncbi:MAG: hypothetical protein P9M11_01320 [Candidatus Tenebribacter burtonii]|nr:hypothetical protein [Candidatus Tenebribacter burtonii]